MARKYKLTTSDTYKNNDAARSEREWNTAKLAAKKQYRAQKDAPMSAANAAARKVNMSGKPAAFSGKTGVKVDYTPLPPGRNIAKSLENLVKKGGGEAGAQARLDKANKLKYLRNRAGGVGPGKAAADVLAGQERYKEQLFGAKKGIMGERKQFPEGDLVGKPKASIPGDLVESKKPTPPANSKGNKWEKGNKDAFSNKSDWQKEAEARKASQQGWQGTKKMSPFEEFARRGEDPKHPGGIGKPAPFNPNSDFQKFAQKGAAGGGGGKGKGRGNWGHKGRPGKKGGSA